VTFDSDCLGDTRGALALAHHEPRELSQQQGVVMSEAIRANGGVGLDDWRGLAEPPRREALCGDTRTRRRSDGLGSEKSEQHSWPAAGRVGFLQRSRPS